MQTTPAVFPVETPADLEDFETLVREYLGSLDYCLDFQGVDEELADLAGAYGPPGGRAYLARKDGTALGCVALRDLGCAIAELKRMYVSPPARGAGYGKALCEAAIAGAVELGYSHVRLDTLAEMTAAGFVPIPRYRENPIEGALYYELDLRTLTVRP